MAICNTLEACSRDSLDGTLPICTTEKALRGKSVTDSSLKELEAVEQSSLSSSQDEKKPSDKVELFIPGTFTLSENKLERRGSGFYSHSGRSSFRILKEQLQGMRVSAGRAESSLQRSSRILGELENRSSEAPPIVFISDLLLRNNDGVGNDDYWTLQLLTDKLGEFLEGEFKDGSARAVGLVALPSPYGGYAGERVRFQPFDQRLLYERKVMPLYAIIIGEHNSVVNIAKKLSKGLKSQGIRDQSIMLFTTNKMVSEDQVIVQTNNPQTDMICQSLYDAEKWDTPKPLTVITDGIFRDSSLKLPLPSPANMSVDDEIREWLPTFDDIGEQARETPSDVNIPMTVTYETQYYFEIPSSSLEISFERHNLLSESQVNNGQVSGRVISIDGKRHVSLDKKAIRALVLPAIPSKVLERVAFQLTGGLPDYRQNTSLKRFQDLFQAVNVAGGSVRGQKYRANGCKHYRVRG